MGAIAEFMGQESMEEFFAPARNDLIDNLIAQYRRDRENIDKLAAIIAGDLGGVVHHFIEGNAGDDRLHRALYVDKLFRTPLAYKALDSSYWSKALQLTDVMDYMPQKRRNEWNQQLTEWRKYGESQDKNPMPLPEFKEATVRSTIASLLSMRAQFFGERVDGIFRGLSGEHVTNQPQGFGKRMIISGVLSTYHTEDHSTCGLINDLRCVIAKFVGRDEPGYSASSALIRTLKGRWGEWVSIDGGALKIRLYRKGTAHLEVHPDMAWRLNGVLAHLYPLAIPPEFRQKPKRKPKDVPLIMRPLPFAVVALLAELKQAYLLEKTDNLRNPFKRTDIKNAVEFDLGYTYDKAGRHVIAEAEAVLESIGGSKTAKGYFQFDYYPQPVIEEIVTLGCIPDQKAHQFYPTPANVADAVIEEAQIGEGDECIEPSAGNGALADRMPKERTTCVEISALRAQVLEAKGYKTVQADFLAWSEQAFTAGTRFDRVIANPPFADGRALAHLQAAARLLRSGGRLVFVLPASMKGKDVGLGAGWSCSWSRIYDNEFAGTSVSVVILRADAPKQQ